jgi:pimeloyl-ACP methyl ester carboxylesterase
MSVRLLIDEDGETAALHELGGSGPPLLLTHGNGLNAGMWATAVPRLRRSFSVWGLDFRGHGRSVQHHERLPVERHWFCDEVLAAVAAITGRPPGPDNQIVAAGHSLGAAALLRTEQDQPGTFRALWAFEPVLIPDTWETDRPPSLLIELSRKRRMVFASVDEAVARFRSKPPFDHCEAEAVHAYVAGGVVDLPDGTVRLTCWGDTEARIYESNERLDFRAFAAIRCPVAVAAGGEVAGGNDIPPLVAPLVAEALGDGRHEVLDGLTHFAPMEDGARVAEAIVAFLAPRAGEW